MVLSNHKHNIPSIYEKNLSLLWTYIRERNKVYTLKQKNVPPPWTNDKILSKYKFVNVFRTQDPGTLYVTKVLIPKYSHNPVNLLYNLLIYRTFNKIETISDLGYLSYKEIHPMCIFEKLSALNNRGVTTFTNAFTVHSFKFWDYLPSNKNLRVAHAMETYAERIEILYEDIMEKSDSKATYEILKTLPGIGEFLAYQISIDIGYWSKELFDEDTFVVAGPGARRGLSRLFPKHKKKDCSQLIKQLVEKHDWKRLELPQPMNLMAMENCLCEISKYLKAYYKEGRPRVRYTPK